MHSLVLRRLSSEIRIFWSGWVICCANTILDGAFEWLERIFSALRRTRTTLSENITALSRPIPNLIRESRRVTRRELFSLHRARPDLRQADGMHLGQLPPRGPPNTPVYPFARIELIFTFPHACPFSRQPCLPRRKISPTVSQEFSSGRWRWKCSIKMYQSIIGDVNYSALLSGMWYLSKFKIHGS